MATTSSSICESSFNVTLITLPVIATSCGCIPTYENTSVLALAGTSIRYTPLISVTVPIVVPFTSTVAAITSSPVWSFTTPVTVFTCAVSAPTNSSNIDNENSTLLFKVLFPFVSFISEMIRLGLNIRLSLY